MIFKKSMNVLGSLCVVAALAGAANVAIAADAPAASAAAAQNLALLGGKLSFKLQGFEKREVPGGGPGTMYYNKDQKRVIMVGEDPLPLIARGGTDDDRLNGMKKTVREKQQAASPDYKIVSEKTETVKGLKVHRIEATDNMDGSNVLQATLLAVDNTKLTVIQVISNPKDPAGHAAAVNNILGK
ncbi:hypothetical protein FXN63_01545 [Pigmentiphaga aceris]|uniref:DUF1795 domain-containing protein n=1 Tax=Pigmentiphaga aceris TaxID=1940612 RepID=A0A5C0ARF9_9BURK|nr:hypothetical protein [Pigmentiphaga aceris]QEI04668.1 hypothetical protein FXN63_01545 [Pigmentiphaga aceris]